MLTSGMVPALFPDDEKEAVLGQVCLYKVYKFVVVRLVLVGFHGGGRVGGETWDSPPPKSNYIPV